MKAQQKMFIVEIDTRGCSNCGDEVGYTVIGPDGVEESAVYNDRRDAEQIAEIMNSEYEQEESAA